MNNANQDNLWSELTTQGHNDKTLDLNLDVKTIMDSWTLKMGYPVVTIRKELNITDNLYVLKITQQWFLLNPLNKMNNQRKLFDTFKWLFLDNI